MYTKLPAHACSSHYHLHTVHITYTIYMYTCICILLVLNRRVVQIVSGKIYKARLELYLKLQDLC
jgi:hypothetical protein